MHANWTKDELKAYTLIYLMNADLEELKTEVNFIKSRTGEDTYTKMHLEFDADNDYQSIQKIKSAHDSLGYSFEEDEVFFEEMKELLSEYSHQHPMEEGLFAGLKKVLKN